MHIMAFGPDEYPGMQGADNTTHLLAGNTSSTSPVMSTPCITVDTSNSGHGLRPTQRLLSESTSHCDDDSADADSLTGTQRHGNADPPDADAIVTSDHNGWDEALVSSVIIRLVLILLPLALLCAAGIVFVVPAFSDPTSPLSLSLSPLVSLPQQHSRTNSKCCCEALCGRPLRLRQLNLATPPPPCLSPSLPSSHYPSSATGPMVRLLVSALRQLLRSP